MINDQLKIAVLWLMLIVCMVLHFNYSISDHFCGIANNIDPTTSPTLLTLPLYLQTLLHILPLTFPVAIMFIAAKPARLVNMGVAIAYTLFHAAHFISQLSQEPMLWIQVELLAVTLGIAIFLCISSWNWVKSA